MISSEKILPILTLCWVLCSCGGTAPTPKPDPVDPKIDSYPELVAACRDWKQGCGSTSVGGGVESNIYHVKSLEDKKRYVTEPGTLRDALMQTDARIIVFDTCGTIHLAGPLELEKKHSNVTILGQSAPGDGICIADYPLVIKGASNVIIRFLRFRMGDTSKTEDDALTVNDSRKVIIDHCSCSWSTDECVSCYGNEEFTLQYCFITESLRKSVHVKGDHGYGGIWGGKNATFHHNLLAHHDSRNPRFDHDYVSLVAGPIDYVNNVVYNWGGNSAYGGEGSSKTTGGGRKVNFVANYYKPGPATASKVAARLLNPTTKCDNIDSNGNHQGCTPKYGGSIAPGKFYLAGNYMFGSSSVTADNWSGVEPDDASKLNDCMAAGRHAMAHSIKMEETATQAFETVLAKAGCSLMRDNVDARIADEVRSGKSTYTGSNGSTGGLIDSQEDVGGWPELKMSERAEDTDKDGMPDEWEMKYGLNPNDRSDARQVSLVTGYRNLEVYLCDMVKHLY